MNSTNQETGYTDPGSADAGYTEAGYTDSRRTDSGYASLSARNVVVKFPGHAHPVLRGVSLDIARGSTTAILGPSGSGKSTLLSVLGGLRKPDSGEVLLGYNEHRATLADPRLLSEVSSWILQTTNILPDRTALDNVAVGAVASGLIWEDALELAQHLLSKVQLTHRIYSRAGTLSGGEVQRIVIARAIASGRDFLLCDEPTGQLDHSTSNLVLEALFELVQSSRVGLVVVTHDPAVAARCDRIVTIDDGVIQSVSSGSGLLEGRTA